MDILSVNINDSAGGAARAALRLGEGLRHLGVNQRLLVQHRSGEIADTETLGGNTHLARAYNHLKPWIDRIPLLPYRQRRGTTWSCNWAPAVTSLPLAGPLPTADLVHLHWIAAGMLPPRSLSHIKVPLLWTLHDMWAFTGGCHIDQECGRYRDRCGHCPQLGSNRDADLSRRLWAQKAKYWPRFNMTIVCPSNWLASLARDSALLGNCRIEVIPNGLDIQCFRPLGRNLARNLLGLPADQQIILYGAMHALQDRNKGFDLLTEALPALPEAIRKQACLVVFGCSEPRNPPSFGLPVRWMGRLHDDISLALLYSAANVMVMPSRQENLPYTVMESMACGTPVVAFHVGGIPDLISHREHGYLARPYDPSDLANGIQWVLASPENHGRMAERARQKVTERYSTITVAGRYLSLYEELLGLAKTAPEVIVRQ